MVRKADAQAEIRESERSFSGLRDTLFAAIDDLRNGRIDVKQANAIAKTAETIVKTVDTQIAYERLRLDSKVPGVLGAMPLVPLVGQKKAEPLE